VRRSAQLPQGRPRQGHPGTRIPDINEAKIVATYHRVTRYHHLPLAQMQAAEQLIAAAVPAPVGREFIRWPPTPEDLSPILLQPRPALRFRAHRRPAHPMGHPPATMIPAPSPGASRWDHSVGLCHGLRLTATKPLGHDSATGQALGLGDIAKPVPPSASSSSTPAPRTGITFTRCWNSPGRPRTAVSSNWPAGSPTTALNANPRPDSFPDPIESMRGRETRSRWPSFTWRQRWTTANPCCRRPCWTTPSSTANSTASPAGRSRV